MSHPFIDLVRTAPTAEIAEAIQKNPSLATTRDAQGVSALLWSVYAGRTPVRDFLLSGLATETLDIFEASACGNGSRLTALLDRDPSLVGTFSPDGWSPLHLAAAFGGPEVTRILIGAGADVCQVSRNPMRNQPLHACLALSRNHEVVRALIHSGADLNAPGGGGFTPLHLAAANGELALVDLLLESGAFPAPLSDQGQTPAALARERQHIAAADRLDKAAQRREPA